ncbi:MAG: glycosyltransferase family 2 protein [Elainellaceae cyanobacterium]
MISFLLASILFGVALVLAVPVTTLLVECLAALFPIHDSLREQSVNPRIAVLVPAHNEASGIQQVLENLLPQLSDRDRLVVIADNCTDETAAIARSTGATVIERCDQERRGKGYALDYGVRFLEADPPDAVVIVDADCIVQPGTLSRISRQAVTSGRPVQALYLMERPAHPTPKDAVSALAFLVKNGVRPQGLARLNLPCLLDGTGMAFPWAVIQQAMLASGNIVEDMQLGVDLAIAGHPVAFSPNTRVTGLLPQQEQAAKSQRTRWEHGHLQTIFTQVPKLISSAIRKRRFDLLALALDLSIPPLSLLVMLWIAAAGLAVLAGLLGLSWFPATVLGAEGLFLMLAILLAWLGLGRSELPLQTLLAVPLYLLWKIPLYLAFVIRPQQEWVRTERDTVNSSKL